MDINQKIQAIVNLYDKGRNPQQLMQMFVQNNGQNQLTQMQTQLKNMAQGKSPKEFILQIAKQNGATEENIQHLARILGAK